MGHHAAPAPDSLRAYLGRIVRNLSISRLRRRTAQKRGAGLEVMLSELGDCLPAPHSVEQEAEAKELALSVSAWGPAESAAVPNPSIRVTFDLDYDDTTVLSYGFSSGFFDRENGVMGRGFSIPQPQEPDYGKPDYLIILGDDIENMEIGGAVTGGWDAEKELDDFGVDVGRYSEGRLEDYRDVYVVDRVCYLKAEVTIPAGESVTLSAQMTKPASFDYDCTRTENRDVSGYDMVTRLGSTLTFTGQTATLEDHGQIEIVRQNFVKQGIRTVELDADTEHCHLEVKQPESAKTE